MVNIEINGIPVQAHDGAMVIEAADEAGIAIPRFCYHSKLSIAANCRMCLVEVEKVHKPVPACATPVTEGMKVFTRSPRAIAAQRNVLEFLLINHPLDCPICDQGGECELQEMAVGYGNVESRYGEEKRVVASKDIGPLVATDMTRCIHCTRCVRFGQEVAGIMELGATGRGEHMRIGTYVEKAVSSELSGNVIDLCPVGALTSKPYRYTARPWELSHGAAIAPHDGVGTHVEIHSRSGEVMRVIPRENEEINESWIADRDRYSYLALEHEERLSTPMIKKDGQWQECDWDSALVFVAEGLREQLQKNGADALAALASPQATTEELYLLQKIMRGLGSSNIDHRLRQQDFSDDALLPAFPWLGQSIADVEKQNSILLVGSDIRRELPLLAQRIRKAARHGASVMDINPLAYDHHMRMAGRIHNCADNMAAELAAVATVLLEGSDKSAPDGLNKLLGSVKPADSHKQIAAALKDAENATVVLGAVAEAHPALAQIRNVAALVAQLANARLAMPASGANSAGAWLAGAVPHRKAAAKADGKPGKNTAAMLDGSSKALVLLGVEPEHDVVNPGRALAAAQSAEFVVSFSGFKTDAMLDYADVLLPIALFAENEGSYVNMEGRWQNFAMATAAKGEARPAWRLLRVLGNLMEVAGFEYMNVDEVHDEVAALCDSVEAGNELLWSKPAEAPAGQAKLRRLADFAMYGVDGLSRRSHALQDSMDTQAARELAINADTAASLSLAADARVQASQDSWTGEFTLRVDASIPDGWVLLASGTHESAGAGAAFAEITVQAV